MAPEICVRLKRFDHLSVFAKVGHSDLVLWVVTNRDGMHALMKSMSV